MKIGKLNVTESRVAWLERIKKSRGDWRRDDCATRNIRTEKKMPEPVYMWLVENHLVDLDFDIHSGTLVLTQKGVDAIRGYRKRESAS